MTNKLNDEVSIKEVVVMADKLKQYLVSKWLIIVIAGITGAAIGLIYGFTTAPIYKAEYSFATEDGKEGGGLSAYAGIASQFGLDLGGAGNGVFSGDNLPELMKSRFIIEKVLLDTITINNKKETLADLYIDFNKLRKKWNGTALQNIHFLPNAPREKFSLQQDSILGVLYNRLIEKNISVDKKDKKLTITTVTVNSEHELFSKAFAEILVKDVSEFYIQTQTKKAKENVQVLQHQVDSVRRELNSAITGVASSIDVNPNPNPALQVLKVPSQHRQVDVQANIAILTELEKNLEISKISLRKETPLIQAIDKPILPLEKEKSSKILLAITGCIVLVLFTIIFLTLRLLYKNILSIENA